MLEQGLVAPRDLIGRRLFGKNGWDQSQPRFDFIHFIDTRIESDLSVDLLGGGNVENKRLRPLTASADFDAQSRRPSSTFEGWAAVLLRDLTFPGWNPTAKISPIIEKNGTTNEFHAEISRDGFRQKAQSYAFATMMADRFSRKGRYVPPVR